MWVCVVLVGLFAVSAGAFHPAPIYWRGLPAKKFVLAPMSLPSSATVQNVGLVQPQRLTIQERSDNSLPDDTPYFTQNADKTITLDGGRSGRVKLCLEAGGNKNGDAIHVNRCTGNPTQLWNVLAGGYGRNTQIQLQDTSKCVDVPSGGLTGAPVELGECDREATEAWEFEEAIAIPTDGPSRHKPLPFAMRHLGITLIALVVLSMSALATWLRPSRLGTCLWRSRRRISDSVGIVSSERGAFLNAEQGGVSLTEHLPMRQDRVHLTPDCERPVRRTLPSEMVLSQISAKDLQDSSCILDAARWRQFLDSMGQLVEDVHSFEKRDIPSEIKIEKYAGELSELQLDLKTACSMEADAESEDVMVEQNARFNDLLDSMGQLIQGLQDPKKSYRESEYEMAKHEEKFQELQREFNAMCNIEAAVICLNPEPVPTEKEAADSGINALDSVGTKHVLREAEVSTTVDSNMNAAVLAVNQQIEPVETDLKSAVKSVSQQREAAERETLENINSAVESVTKQIESVNKQREVAESEAMEKIKKQGEEMRSSIDSAVESVNKTREAAETEVLEKIAEAASGMASSTAAIENFGGGFLSRLPGGLFIKRTVQIWSFVAEMSLKISAAQRTGSVERKAEIGDELCEGLLRLGPTFIKFGQILSTRYDILEYEYVKGLEKLQDSCPAFDGEAAYEIVRQEVGPNAFSSFDREPIAAASLGQVHLAKTASGQQVAVKVQRPGLKELFEVDLYNLKILADLLYQLDESPDSMLRDWKELFESNARILYEEIDYRKEAANGRKFASLFSEDKWVKVPLVYDDLSSTRVLTMEYVPGIKISNVKELRKQGFNPVDLGRQSGECFMIQMLRHGFFHCDPHPGNIAVDRTPGGEPRLVYYDFGMVDELTESFRKALVDAFFALFDAEPTTAPKQIVQALIDAEMLGGKVDRVALERIARNFLGNFRQRLVLDRSLPISNKEKDKLRMTAMNELGNELAAVAADRPFRYPRGLPYVLRAFNALEGVGKALDPNYDITRIAKKYIRNLIDLRDGNAAITIFKNVQTRLGWRPKDFASIVQSPRRVTEVYETLSKIESGEVQLRVRAVELERAMVRNTVMQRASLYAIAACCAVNVATVVAVAKVQLFGIWKFAGRFAWMAAAFCGSRAVLALKKFNQLQKGEREGNLAEYILESKRS